MIIFEEMEANIKISRTTLYSLKWTTLQYLVVSIIGLTTICSCALNQKYEKSYTFLPPVPTEFRGVWIASVANINWPSNRNMTVPEQKDQAIQYLDLLDSLNYNAVILQVRPQADALYPSDLEPWSYFLTGEQGKAPIPYYDPLQFWIEQAHQRGIELHAWLNPFRAHHPTGGPISELSLVRTYPHLVVQLQNGYWWFDPGQAGTKEHALAVVMDLVKRYDLDGIHFDDYFYPYPSYNNHEDFPDSVSWIQYQSAGGKLDRDDWRRQSVNQFIREVYTSIKKAKKYVKFSISPFGIWRPNHPETIQGFDQYDELYADAKLWLNKGWIDFFTPQLYWPINQIPQSFPVLLNWWDQENTKRRPLWPGLSIGRKKSTAAADEVINQIMICRAFLPLSGTVHWSIAPLLSNDTLTQELRKGPYRSSALVPSMRHLSRKIPAKTSLKHKIQGDSLLLYWNSDKETSQWILYLKYGGKWSWKILPGNTSEFLASQVRRDPNNPDDLQRLRNAALISQNRYGVLSRPSFPKSYKDDDGRSTSVHLIKR